MSCPRLEAVFDVGAIEDDAWDSVVWVGPSPMRPSLAPLDEVVVRSRAIDQRLDHEVGLWSAPRLAGGRLVTAPTGPLHRDQDDVRRFGEAARAGVRRALAAGSVKPLVVVGQAPGDDRYGHAENVVILEALGSSWSPLEAREARGESFLEPMQRLGWLLESSSSSTDRVTLLWALEEGRRAARDVTGTEPERMAPRQIADYCRELFRPGVVSVSTVSDRGRLEAEYPLLSAVGRASFGVPRHAPCVLRLAYQGEGPVERTLLLAGKGVTYDTGGADIKYGGAMAGMSRDKGGAGAVVGIMAFLQLYRPPNLRVVAEIGAVRNSIGSDAFVTDEILTSHAGVRVRVGNTDAEGRLVLADLLSHLRFTAAEAKNPYVVSIATLTGHVGRAVGPYTVAIDNGPARRERWAERLSVAGDAWGEPVEVSRLRREDWDFVRPRSPAEDVISCNNAASTATPRGHQFPMAFLCLASGMDSHGLQGTTPLPFTHLDIGAAAVEGGDWQHGRPTGAPVLPLLASLLGF